MKESNAAEQFSLEFKKHLKFFNYDWTSGKDISIKWVADQISFGNVLDIGGTVRLLKLLANEKGIIASIFDAFPINGLDSKEYKRAYIGEFSNLLDIIPSSEKFDTVVCRHSLEHCLNPLFILWQINQLLVSNGKLIVLLPPHNKKWIWFYTHFNCLPEENWEMLFYRSGFRIEKKEYGQWDKKQKDLNFRETRYVLISTTKDLQLDYNY